MLLGVKHSLFFTSIGGGRPISKGIGKGGSKWANKQLGLVDKSRDPDYAPAVKSKKNQCLNWLSSLPQQLQ